MVILILGTCFTYISHCCNDCLEVSPYLAPPLSEQLCQGVRVHIQLGQELGLKGHGGDPFKFGIDLKQISTEESFFFNTHKREKQKYRAGQSRRKINKKKNNVHPAHYNCVVVTNKCHQLRGKLNIVTSLMLNRAGHLIINSSTTGPSRTTSCLLRAKVFSILTFISSLLLRFFTSKSSSR